MITEHIDKLERQLDSLNGTERHEALMALLAKAARGDIHLPLPTKSLNVHMHTFHSYNAYGYSPSKLAWLARKEGLAVAGIVDFDVLDGLDEFFSVSEKLDLKVCAGMETRVFVPEFADKVITSFGEPGITYHMGIGFPCSEIPEEYTDFYSRLKIISQRRNQAIIDKVNKYLSPVKVDYKDICALTPSDNVTERHICLAYAFKANELFGRETDLRKFWSDRLDVSGDELDLPLGYNLIKTIRTKTMKYGSAGYIPPDRNSFTRMEDFNRFVKGAGGIPALTWVDGISEGEQDMERLCRLAMRTEVSAINVIPDPKYTPHPNGQEQKLKNLYSLVDMAREFGLLIIAGTEMNILGQHFVDNFGSEQLQPLLPYFLKSAYVFYAHTMLERCCGMGYLSNWAEENFISRSEKNDFFATVGEVLPPVSGRFLGIIKKNMAAQEVLTIIENTNMHTCAKSSSFIAEGNGDLS